VPNWIADKICKLGNERTERNDIRYSYVDICRIIRLEHGFTVSLPQIDDILMNTVS
jgi:hypothetical protein